MENKIYNAYYKHIYTCTYVNVRNNWNTNLQKLGAKIQDISLVSAVNFALSLEIKCESYNVIYV